MKLEKPSTEGGLENERLIGPESSQICPMFVGAAQLSKRRLSVRTVTGEVEVQAPPAMLDHALTLCDGTRNLVEILALIPSQIGAECFRRFLSFLFDVGALIDANLYTAQALRYGFQNSPYGASLAAQLTDQISRRFAQSQPPLKGKIEFVRNAPLASFFDERISTYTFDDVPVDTDKLLSLLWSLCGVVAAQHERLGARVARRAIASAGAMHLLQVYVVLRRQVGRYKARVYRVHYPQSQSIVLEPVSLNHQKLPRAFTQPWNLTFATGAIFVAGDVATAATRYRNRALQYLFMEAGAALHNGALTAPKLSLGYAPLGNYYENVVAELCCLSDEVVLGSAIFGVKPTSKQLTQTRLAPDIEFTWVDAVSPVYSVPFYLARANLRKNAGGADFAWGRDSDPWVASRKATAEIIERQGMQEPKNLSVGAFADFANACDPRNFVRYSARQYSLSTFPYKPFSERQSYCWTEGVDCLTGEKVRVLAEMVYARAALPSPVPRRRRLYAQATTSGCATGESQPDALDRAMLEVIERDAFMRHWLAQQPGVGLRLSAISSDFRQRISAVTASGCEVGVQLLPSPWATVVMVWAQHHLLHFTTLGTAAHDDWEVALGGALSELESRVFVWLNGHKPGKALSPEGVATTSDHFEIYGLRKYYQRAGNVLNVSAEITARQLKAIRTQLKGSLCDRFAAQGIAPVCVDITPEKCAVDQGRTHLTVVKALVPGLIPMSFGFQREPRGMVQRVHSGAKFPHPFP